MSESVSPLEESPGENKVLGRHKWRMNFFSADGKFGRANENLQSTEADIANFLQTTSARPEVRSRSAPLVPHSDAAAGSAWLSAGQANSEPAIVDIYRAPKPRQNKGLRVSFESKAPEVIGVGGDEAELPSRDVSRSFAGLPELETLRSQETLHHDTNDQGSHANAQATRRAYDQDSFGRLPPRRRPHRVDDEELADESHHVGRDHEVVQSTFPEVRNLSPRRRDEERRNGLESQERHARNFSGINSIESEASSHDHRCSWQTAESSSHLAARHLDDPPPKALSASSLIPNWSPEPLDASQEVPSVRNDVVSDTNGLSKQPNTGQHGIVRISQDISHREKYKPLSLRTVAPSLEHKSLDDFDSRVRRFNDLFRLNASAHVDTMALSFKRWVMVSAWWFLKGRGGLESAARRKFSGIASANAVSDGDPLKQAYVDLAKAWWVLRDVTPNLPEIRRFGNASLSTMVVTIKSFNDEPLAELVGVQLDLRNSIRTLTMSMDRNGMLPPDDLQMQGLDLQILVETPGFSSKLAALMVNNVRDPSIKGENYVAEPFFPILVGDTARHFCFGQMFVDLFMDYRDDGVSEIHIPSVVSILRERTDWTLKVAVASQDGQVTLVIQSGEHGGLHWHDVQWKIPLYTMQLGLAENVSLRIKFSEKDFKTIWGICDYTQRIRKEYSGRRGEELLCERELPIVQCFDSPSFPTEPMEGCRVRLFEKREDCAKHRAHNGYRFMVITNPATKTLSRENYELGSNIPLLLSTHQKENRNHLLLKVPSSFRVSLTFHDPSDVELFGSILAGKLITGDDHCSAFLQLHDYTISPVPSDPDAAYWTACRYINDLRWHKLRVVNRDPPSGGHDSQPTIRSEHLRILAECESGTFTDRINAEPGELHLNLSVENLNEIKLLRAAQQDMTCSFTDGVLRDADLSSLSHMLRSISTSRSIRKYQFSSLSDLHCFQAMVTGFHVLYDELASTFSISRPRLIALHKRWEANTPRLQIIQHDKTVQLVAFFKDFSHGVCMNFVLKVTDFFDTFTRSGMFFLRIVDAKFALPKGETDTARDFVCLDTPEYPGEHDDIIIGFDSEQGRDRFTQTLPAPVNKMSRMASLRR